MSGLSTTKIQTYNFITDLNNKSTDVIKSQSSAISNDLLSKFNVSTANKLEETERVCRDISLTNANNSTVKNEQISAAVNNSISFIEQEKEKYSSLYESSLDRIVSTQKENNLVAIDLFAQKSAITNGVSPISFEYMSSWSLSRFNTLWASITQSMTNLVETFKNLISARLEAITIGFRNLLNFNFSLDIDPLGLLRTPSSPNPFGGYSTPIFDFYNRSSGLGSTSLYIQQNLPDPKNRGRLVANPKASVGTPTSKILLPKVKVDVQVVQHYLSNPLAKIFPKYVMPLIPYKSIKITGETIKK